MSALGDVKWQPCLACFRWVVYRTASAVSGDLVARTRDGKEGRRLGKNENAIASWETAPSRFLDGASGLSMSWKIGGV